VSRKRSSALGQAAESHYLARPDSETEYGVLVVHAWWGLTPFFKAFCDRLAQQGHAVLARDLYRGRTATTTEEAKRLSSRLKRDVVAEEITRAVGDLDSARMQAMPQACIGVVGFSLGAYWALWLAEHKLLAVRATVAFYGSRNGDYAACQSAFQFHLAESDDCVAESGVNKLQKALKAAGRNAEFYTYPGTTHWFTESDRAEAYNPQAAAAGLEANGPVPEMQYQVDPWILS
jgi:carboxymethylenebutenolidase